MVGYIDSSVLLRILLREPNRLESIQDFSELVASELLRIECMRVLHRYRMTGVFTDQQLTERISSANELLDEISLIMISPLVLRRASLPTPTILGTLDAIHLVSAQLWQERKNTEIIMLSHDSQLRTASQAVGIKVRD